MILRTADGQEVAFDRVVVATHADEALALLADPTEEERRLATAARWLGHVFNPASFFLCRRADGALECALVQVRNTFGEMHLYLVPGGGDGVAAGVPLRGRAEKVFHVSPFFPRRGGYEFLVSDAPGRFDAVIRYRDGGKQVFAAHLQGRARPLDGPALARTLLRHPFVASLTVPRILWQAARLRWQRRLPVFPKPAAASPMTVRTEPASRATAFERVGRRALAGFFARLARGRLRVEHPDGTKQSFGANRDGREEVLRVVPGSFFRRALFGGEIGFGEAFVAGDWETPDLTGLLRLLARHIEEVNRHHLLGALGAAKNRLLHLARPNTVRGSRRNISAHYDLSNEFFALFLDPTLSYSCAIFADGGEDLEAAQRRKIRAILERAGVGAGHHLLEIGCG